MSLSASAKEQLQFWKDLPEGISMPLTHQAASHTVTTDASETGIGILFNGCLISEQIPSDYSHFHICVKELFALL